MDDGIVWLRNPYRPDLRSNWPPSVHEAAHARQFYLDPFFSQFWVSQFPIERDESEKWYDPKVRVRNKLFHSYCAFDHTKDEDTFGEPDETFFSEPDMSFKDGKLRVDFYGDGLDFRGWYDHVLIECNALPGYLRERVSHISIKPDLVIDGLFQWPEDPVETYLKTTEDVATSVSMLYITTQQPKSHTNVIRLVNTDRRAKGKLMILVETGFLDEESMILVDPQFTRYFVQ